MILCFPAFCLFCKRCENPISSHKHRRIMTLKRSGDKAKRKKKVNFKDLIKLYSVYNWWINWIIRAPLPCCETPYGLEVKGDKYPVIDSNLLLLSEKRAFLLMSAGNMRSPPSAYVVMNGIYELGSVRVSTLFEEQIIGSQLGWCKICDIRWKWNERKCLWFFHFVIHIYQ